MNLRTRPKRKNRPFGEGRRGRSLSALGPDEPRADLETGYVKTKSSLNMLQNLGFLVRPEFGGSEFIERPYEENEWVYTCLKAKGQALVFAIREAHRYAYL